MDANHRLASAVCKHSRALGCLLLLALAPAGCKDRPQGAQGAQGAGVASAAAASSAPTVVACYQGCIDLNRGKPVDPAELHKNCEHKCVRICSKACAVPQTQTPYEQAMEACGKQCKEQLDKGR